MFIGSSDVFYASLLPSPFYMYIYFIRWMDGQIKQKPKFVLVQERVYELDPYRKIPNSRNVTNRKEWKKKSVRKISFNGKIFFNVNIDGTDLTHSITALQSDKRTDGTDEKKVAAVAPTTTLLLFNGKNLISKQKCLLRCVIWSVEFRRCIYWFSSLFGRNFFLSLLLSVYLSILIFINIAKKQNKIETLWEIGNTNGIHFIQTQKQKRS